MSENLNSIDALNEMTNGKKFQRIKSNGEKGCVYELQKTKGGSWNLYKNGRHVYAMNIAEILSEYELVDEENACPSSK